ncbi:MAG: hypothetical protein M3Y59_23120 [Myxococcota bacterium]|nr:hypothetical protein [Myxococcota bacterium]
MKEPPLWPVEVGARDALRVLVVQPMRVPFLTRAIRSSVGWDVVAAESRGSRPDAVRRTHSVLDGELLGVRTELDAAGFWAGGFKEELPQELHPCVWLIEGIQQGRYSFAVAYAPVETVKGERLRAAALELLRIGGLDAESVGQQCP